MCLGKLLEKKQLRYTLSHSLPTLITCPVSFQFWGERHNTVIVINS